MLADEVVSIPLDIDLRHTVICPRDLFDGHRPYPLPENPASVLLPHVLGRQVVAWEEELSAYWIPTVWLAGDIRLPLIPTHYAPRLEKETAARLMGARVIRVEDCREGVEFEFDRPLGLTSGREDQPSEAASSLGCRTLVLSPLTALIVSP